MLLKPFARAEIQHYNFLLVLCFKEIIFYLLCIICRETKQFKDQQTGAHQNTSIVASDNLFNNEFVAESKYCSLIFSYLH